jgi:demethylmenaquinone methyltransferase/2-methoxy-6-polyprenyl-1,4-benzoquinol methylase
MENPPEPTTSQPLHGMFTVVPPRYDLVNRIITLGLDKRWRRIAAETCLENNPETVLDLGCGTGDLTINIARLAGKNTEIIGLDYSQPMLEIAQQKATKVGVVKSVRFTQSDAAALPFPDAYFDCVGNSFAFRNLTYKNPLAQAHLAEVKRVLKPGGRYVIAESSQPENPVIRAMFRLYVRIFVAPVGIIISGNPGAYRYLTESITRFYTPPEVRDILKAAGFRNISYRPLLLGATGIHVAFK